MAREARADRPAMGWRPPAVRLFPPGRWPSGDSEGLERDREARATPAASRSNGGKKSHVWCNPADSGRMLRCRGGLSCAVFLRVLAARLRPHGGEDVDPRWRADMGSPRSAFPRRGGRTWSRSTRPRSRSRVRSRLDGYRDCPHPVLFLTTTPSRARVFRCMECPDPRDDHRVLPRRSLGEPLDQPSGL